jgi:hypothetical protein
MEVGFIAWLLSWCALSALLTMRGRPMAAAAVAVAAVGLAAIAAFHTQAVAGELPNGVHRTLGGRLHDVGGELLFGGLVAAAGALAVSRQSTTAVRWAGSGLVVLALLSSAVLLGAGDPVPGVRQRVALFAAVAWQALVIRDVADAHRLPRPVR